jgi:hypothetical protein
MPANRRRQRPAETDPSRLTWLVVDGSSPVTFLEYEGGPTPKYVPARDLSGGDLARIAYRRAADVERRGRSLLVRPGEKRAEPQRPGPASVDELEALATELTTSGAFVRVATPVTEPPAPPAAPAPAPED